MDCSLTLSGGFVEGFDARLKKPSEIEDTEILN